MGISYIHMDVGEGEAIAAELCRIGYVDYVLTGVCALLGLLGPFMSIYDLSRKGSR